MSVLVVVLKDGREYTFPAPARTKTSVWFLEVQDFTGRKLASFRKNQVTGVVTR